MLELPANRLIISRRDARMRVRKRFSRAEYARVEVAQNYYRRVAVLIMIARARQYLEFRSKLYFIGSLVFLALSFRFSPLSSGA